MVNFGQKTNHMFRSEVKRDSTTSHDRSVLFEHVCRGIEPCTGEKLHRNCLHPFTNSRDYDFLPLHYDQENSASKRQSVMRNAFLTRLPSRAIFLLMSLILFLVLFITLTNSSQSHQEAINEQIFWHLDLEGQSLHPALDGINVLNQNLKIKRKFSTKCGKHSQAIIQNGLKLCIISRPNQEQFIGEIYSYHLNQLLGMNNVPHLTWNLSSNQQVMSQWIEDLKPVTIPKDIRQYLQIPTSSPPKLSIRNSLNYRSLNFSQSHKNLVQLSQWSDVVIFDYITANLDRLINNMHNQLWNSESLESASHNTFKIPSSNDRLVLVDNESGLFHGYRLLDTYQPYFKTLLQSICIFRPSTVQKIETLNNDKNVADKLTKLTTTMYQEKLPDMPMKNKVILQQRIDEVFKHMQNCRNL